MSSTLARGSALGLGLGLALTLFVLGARADGRVSVEDRARIERALLAIDSRPPAAFWASLGERGRLGLFDILDDTASPRALRRRAVLALAHFPGAASEARLVRLASLASEDPIVSRFALRALLELDAPSALASVERALEDARVEVREGAVLTLARLRERGRVEPSRARASLEALRRRERDVGVREAIDRALTR